MLTLSQGRLLVRLARDAIAHYLAAGERLTPPGDSWLKEKRGVFTTLRTYPTSELRGCIGFPYPVKPLGEAVVDSAISAATEDPRFYPISADELADLTVEVTVLTRPRLLSCSPDDRPKHIVVGRHGLIVRSGMFSGLLLPQVPSEVGWTTPEEFLDGTCSKAGLEPGCWCRDDVDVYVFEGQIFSEKVPKGEVVAGDSQED